MGKLTQIAKRLLDGDTKSLIKARFFNDDLSLSREGVSALIAIMLSDKDIMEKMVKAAEEQIQEDKEERE